MQTATIWLELDSTLKNNVRKGGVTPAQAQVMWQMFGKEIQGGIGPDARSNPFHHIEIDPSEVERTNQEEFARLGHIYGTGKDSVLRTVFPGANPKLPTSFKEVGLSDTELAEPKAGTKHTIEPLASLPNGDLTDEEKLAMVSASHPMAEMVAGQKATIEAQQVALGAHKELISRQQEQLDKLTKMVEELNKPKENPPQG